MTCPTIWNPEGRLIGVPNPRARPVDSRNSIILATAVSPNVLRIVPELTNLQCLPPFFTVSGSVPVGLNGGNVKPYQSAIKADPSIADQWRFTPSHRPPQSHAAGHGARLSPSRPGRSNTRLCLLSSRWLRTPLDASGVSTSNVAEIHNQVMMMLGHEIFDPELNRRVLVDHAFIVAGGEITKQARN